jgi:hypothetical protein
VVKYSLCLDLIMPHELELELQSVVARSQMAQKPLLTVVRACAAEGRGERRSARRFNEYARLVTPARACLWSDALSLCGVFEETYILLCGAPSGD